MTLPRSVEQISASSLDDTMFRPETETIALDQEKLALFLAEQGFELEIGPVRQFRGGLANLNYCLIVDGRAVVLRCAPKGELPRGAHDMAREHYVLSRLSKVFNLAPESVLLCEDKSILGSAFQLIEYRPGIIIRGTDMSAVSHIPDAGQRLADMMVQTLCDLHQVDTSAAGLEDFGKPEGFISRAIAGWTKRGLALNAPQGVLNHIQELHDWLDAKNQKGHAENTPTLLHSDFKLDNMILNPQTLHPTAIVDWDMSTRGEPLFDLATLLSYWCEPGDPPCMQRLGQMPTAEHNFPPRAEIIAAYGARSGRNLENIHMLHVCSMLKLAIIFLQLFERWKSGAMGDERYRQFDTLGAELLTFALDLRTENQT